MLTVKGTSSFEFKRASKLTCPRGSQSIQAARYQDQGDSYSKATYSDETDGRRRTEGEIYIYHPTAIAIAVNESDGGDNDDNRMSV